MPFVSECPSCGQKLKVPDNLAGKKVRCSKCASTFVAESVTASAPAPPPPRREEPAEERFDDLIDDRDDDRPVRRSRSGRAERSEGGAAPGRGGMLMTFGIISVTLAVVAIGSGVAGMFCAPLGICSLVLVIVGLILGIIAWLMSSGDLKKIHSGTIDAAAQGGTKTGFVCGIIGTISNGLLLACSCIGTLLVIIGVAAMPRQAGGAGGGGFGPGGPRRSFQLPPPKLSQYLPDRPIIGAR